MKIIVIVGSPRKNGNTDLLANEFAKGASINNEVEVLNISDYKINPCNGCNACKINKCIYNDDMPYKKLSEADALVFATPIYFYNVSAQLKMMIDRLHNPIRKTFKVKKLGLLMVCADTIDEVFSSTITMYEDILNYFKLESIGIIKVKGVSEKGDIKNRNELIEAYNLGKNCR